MDKNSGSSGVGLSSLLTIIFVVLKLVGVINWSWWWVLSPIFASIGLGIIVISIKAILEVRRTKKLQAKKEKK